MLFLFFFINYNIINDILIFLQNRTNLIDEKKLKMFTNKLRMNAQQKVCWRMEQQLEWMHFRPLIN